MTGAKRRRSMTQSSASDEDLGDIVHEPDSSPAYEPDDVQVPTNTIPSSELPSQPTGSLITSSKNKRNPQKLPPAARADEWSDSSENRSPSPIQTQPNPPEQIQTLSNEGTRRGLGGLWAEILNNDETPLTSSRRRPQRSKRGSVSSTSTSTSRPTKTGVKPLSMTASAVDYRKRHLIDENIRDDIKAIISKEIQDEVEAEGGITPIGRFHKSILRYLQAHQSTHKKSNPVELLRAGERDELKKLRKENEDLRGQLRMDRVAREAEEIKRLTKEVEALEKKVAALEHEQELQKLEP